MEEKEKGIDIVVTYLDESKENWREGYKERKEKEIESGVQERRNRQAFGEERTREWETLKYWLRGVEKNCKFVRNIIIVVYDENQVPKWVNLDNERIRIVTHKEYMPKEIIPTYNAIAIRFYMSRIRGISERYIVSDDDCYFINEVTREMYEECGKMKIINSELPYKLFDKGYLSGSDGVFYAMFNNNLEFEKKYMVGEKKKYWISHLPDIRDREYEKRIIEENEEIFKEPFKISRFRHKDQYTSDLFLDIIRIKGECILSDEFKEKCKYVTLRSDVDFDRYKDYKIVCFNDTEQLDDYEVVKRKLIKFLEEKLPEKSSFEK